MKITIYKTEFEVLEPGQFALGIHSVPYGFRIIGPAMWQFSAGPADIRVHQNSFRSLEAGAPKTIRDRMMFSGTSDTAGTFTLFIPLAPFEDVEYTFVP